VLPGIGDEDCHVTKIFKEKSQGINILLIVNVLPELKGQFIVAHPNRELSV
jgi:hypothetical protein